MSKDYGKLTTEAVDLINPKGHLIASTNAANVTMNKFTEMVEKGISETGRKFSKKQIFRLPSDFEISETFQDGNYLKVLIYEIL